MTDLLIRALPLSEFETRIPELNEVLIGCVADGASVSFMHPLSVEKATKFWQNVARSVANSERVVLVAEDEHQQIVGTVQLITDQPENQPHRADVAKLLVHPRARRRGIAQRLMQQLEIVAQNAGKTVLVLDTATGSDAEMFYRHLGWQRAGELPKYALMPDGAFCATTFYFKHL
ncbi:GNAT family N-acetyltransferase [Enterobacteriaceae bacterium H20N1]|uniref:GNAT family N-acetyltransferase n=1 Tax=Dryocola boscaweniae TaxID=2925397 RepID=A0A9X2WAL6_9ENTR|nr:GNAT family N-acetyltransferase [Dryocola boscaweniae]MCT4703825.1 GNAT family N-acetyltransferase [Dryocola boscaweniae]MCT4720993.1 GNAT family N-acetyltransferase [Dryocola boscaweniae]